MTKNVKMTIDIETEPLMVKTQHIIPWPSILQDSLTMGCEGSYDLRWNGLRESEKRPDELILDFVHDLLIKQKQPLLTE